MTHVVSRRIALAGTLLLTLTVPAGAQIAAGYTQDFQDATHGGWSAGGGPIGATPLVPPIVIGGGRMGATDLFLQITGDGSSGPGGRLTAHNRSLPWSGDYRAAGISAIELWVRNLGTSDIALRLGFSALLGGGGGLLSARSLTPFFVPGGSSWMPVTFSLSPGALGGVAGADLETVMRSVFEIRLMHATTMDDPPDRLAGVLGVDDLRVIGGAPVPPPTAVPEPATVALLGTGLLALAAVARRRRR